MRVFRVPEDHRFASYRRQALAAIHFPWAHDIAVHQDFPMLTKSRYESTIHVDFTNTLA